MIEITEDEIWVAEVMESVRRPGAGAVVVFLGTVRSEPGLDGLELETYKDMAMEKMKAIHSEVMGRFSVLEASIVQRVGKMAIGEDIVVIAVSAAHRSEAFAAGRYFIDELKVTVPIWKKELGPGTWVEGEVPREVGTERIRGMVDISDKEVVPRSAVAEGHIDLSRDSLRAIGNRTVKKGDVLEAAKIAAVSGVKHTPTLIPLCHPIPITAVEVRFDILDKGIRVNCMVKGDYRTGVEMEALTGVNSALLTIWDMVKYIEKDEDGQYPSTRIHDVRVLSKKKG